MNEFAKDAVGFLIGCVAVAVVVLAFWGGIALLAAQGQAQTCARSGGHWYAHSAPLNDGAIQDRECRR